MEYKKYKWFYTKNKKLVVAGKSAENNDKLLKEILDTGKEYWVCHTSHPGSPFSVIIDGSKKDIEEAAMFTGCFSRAWKQGKKKTKVNIFKSSQLQKIKGMKIGTWGVLGRVEKMEVSLKLVLTKQKNVWKAVPEKSAGKKILGICPGNVDKEKRISVLIDKIKEKSKMKIDKNQLIAALPAGGFEIY
ncbi:hypothetical protein COU62_01705 [Candidatus Pacearchaeota archaeon CG10_big_fil_rev_8_21_14_0_10_35_219]|nr:DUF814 domain-containing protein [Candidatus Pacearchaeota archaeon]OIO43147.1 MAG: hypothetical protein AUJ63_00980 [Candidatus Pacearchaeota archaeon CG1_02_35_32]PIO08077.1 MAG: hypothetical protein COU62_01705 [Candidatus Pacearchaeota archaeon CG10_big_fil_rev_8_21_14_0_10_35_219]PIY81590.1 MAG: hypothetical protein COY79_02540 [Candidatus Pacearchaeota archaeon CG_4_10_14_0_8_um_filter_35_169]PIZ78965.1 MAG: hypothetical protein COY00_04925 [Candidatus Pacearchaeota archaeon CG_4_10_14